jgi:hypothetical protein
VGKKPAALLIPRPHPDHFQGDLSRVLGRVRQNSSIIARAISLTLSERRPSAARGALSLRFRALRRKAN